MLETEEVIYRTGTLCDVEQIGTLEREGIENPWSEEMIRKDMEENQNSHYIVMEVEDSDEKSWIAGFVGFSVVLDEMEINNIVVSSALRRNGGGTALLSQAIEFAKILGAKNFYLEVREKNVNAIEFYKKNGFGIIGQRKAYYSNPLDNAVLMKMGE